MKVYTGRWVESDGGERCEEGEREVEREVERGVESECRESVENEVGEKWRKS